MRLKQNFIFIMLLALDCILCCGIVVACGTARWTRTLILLCFKSFNACFSLSFFFHAVRVCYLLRARADSVFIEILVQKIIRNKLVFWSAAIFPLCGVYRTYPAVRFSQKSLALDDVVDGLCARSGSCITRTAAKNKMEREKTASWTLGWIIVIKWCTTMHAEHAAHLTLRWNEWKRRKSTYKFFKNRCVCARTRWKW